MRTVLRLGRGFGLALTLFVALACLLGQLFQPGAVHRKPEKQPAPKIEQAEALRDIALDGEPPRLVVDVDYSEGATATWYPKNEAPT